MLYLVPTPIGNLGDLSDRIRQALAEADFIAAEDTRVTMKLLRHLDLNRPLVSYHEHNKRIAGPKILARLQAGETCALVTDAGTPAISDPGEDLVKLCIDAGVIVTALPGPCALITALCISGLPTARFTFEGFLPTAAKDRRERLEQLLAEQRTMIFYEAPHRLRETLRDLAEAFGPNRPIALCRELTKLHEEALRLRLGEAVTYYEENEPRGEYVLVLGGAPEAVHSKEVTLEEALTMVRQQLDAGKRKKEAVRAVSELTGFPRNALYDAVLNLED
ncbi:MAG: 16S rRNA (cytidine(1402)-2'-O)-methyltransferase [Oscillospiraceae bacterium]|nr:16S rRNA (cytidine(1402)-2'-O)-methyltransferase [Oscillospiraceae bacterium]